MLLLFFLGSVYADTFYVGGKKLKIPSPQGFTRVTPQMDAVYRLSQELADPVNDQLAFYIQESEIPAAMSGEIPSLEHYYILKVNKKLKGVVVGSKDFAELKNITKRQNRESLKSVETEVLSLMEKASKGIAKILTLLSQCNCIKR